MTFKVSAKMERKSPAKLKAALAALKDLDKGPDRVKVGWPAGTPGGILERAVFNEMGTKTIPERPALRNAMRANRSKYQRAIKAEMRSLLKTIEAGGSISGAKVGIMSRLGILGQGDVQSEITSLQSPPNAPSTIARKKSSNPLIETGQMRAAVSWQLIEEGGPLSSVSPIALR